jgi:hypothetical protein
MTELRAAARTRVLDSLAKGIDEVLEEIYGKRVGFALFMFEFGPDGKAGDYVSNSQKEDMIKFMREVADRLEVGQSIGIPIGEA